MIAAGIGLAFGLLWWMVGASALPRPAGIAAGVVGVLLFAAATVRVRGVAGGRGGVFIRRYYVGAVIGEIAAIMLVQALLPGHGKSPLLFPMVGVIVGVHFIGLWLAMRAKRFLWLAAALVTINLVALLVPVSDAGRRMVSGFGSSAALMTAAAS